jgi:spore coat protein CotH
MLTFLVLGCLDTTAGGDTGTADTSPPPVLDLVSGPGDFLYQTDQILMFDLTVSDESMAQLEASPREDVHADLTFLGETLDVGFRLKGNSSYTWFDEKPAFKIDVHEYEREQTLHGVRRLTLNNFWQDGSMMHEHTAYRLYTLAGVPGPRHGYARVRVNGEDYGLYGIVETMDEQFIDRWWDDDDTGNLYENYPGRDLSDHAVEDFKLQEAGVPTDRSDLTDLVTVLDDAGGDIADVLDLYFHRDALLARLAVELIMSNDDGYVSSANNYLLYHQPVADKWTLLPWGEDQAMSGDSDLYSELEGRLATQCLADPGCFALFEDTLRDVLDAWEDSDLTEFVHREADRIEADCLADERANHGCERRLEEAREFADERVWQVLDQI